VTMNDDVRPFDPRVHQAEGMLTARYGVPISEAAGMLRAWAARGDVTVPEMAAQVVGTLVARRGNGHPSR
jgi:ANTAR domain-containing protein